MDRVPTQRQDGLGRNGHTREFQAMARGGTRTEKLWLNFPADQSFTHFCAGKDYNDRFRIKQQSCALENNV